MKTLQIIYLNGLNPVNNPNQELENNTLILFLNR